MNVIYAVILCYTLNGAPDPNYPGGPCKMVHEVTSYNGSGTAESDAVNNLALCQKEAAMFNHNSGYTPVGHSLKEECRQRELPTWDTIR
jgi:hypothetical protein